MRPRDPGSPRPARPRRPRSCSDSHPTPDVLLSLAGLVATFARAPTSLPCPGAGGGDGPGACAGASTSAIKDHSSHISFPNRVDNGIHSVHQSINCYARQAPRSPRTTMTRSSTVSVFPSFVRVFSSCYGSWSASRARGPAARANFLRATLAAIRARSARISSGYSSGPGRYDHRFSSQSIRATRAPGVRPSVSENPGAAWSAYRS